MEALSLKLRCEDTKLCDVIVKAEQCISHIKDDDNKRNLIGNWYLVLSCWYRHQRKFQNAREYLEKAKSELRSGIDCAYILHSEACLLLEDESNREDKIIIKLLEDAIRGFHLISDRTSTFQAGCYLKQALCCIGSSLSYPRIVQRSPSEPDKTGPILTKVGKKLDALPLRLQMQYYTIKFV